MTNWKTTTLGFLTILAALTSAALAFLKTGTIDWPTVTVGISAGIGLLKAKDAPPSDTGVNCHWLVTGFALLLVVLSLGSCSVTTQADGSTVQKVDQEAVNPWLELARDLFVPVPKAQQVPIIQLDK